MRRGSVVGAVVFFALSCAAGALPASVHADDNELNAERGAAVSRAEAVQTVGTSDASDARRRSKGFGIPPFSVRLDPFNWLIRGRLNFELEVAVWRLITVEFIPSFIVSSEPATFDYGGRPGPVRQESAGVGPLAGGTLGVGLWFRGAPFTGYVLRFAVSNISVRMRAEDGLGEFDRVTKTERQVQMLLGSHTRIQWFTLAGDIGVGYELHQQQRCFANPGRADSAVASTGCQDDAFAIRLDRQTQSTWDLNGPIEPFYFLARFSIGVVFD